RSPSAPEREDMKGYKEARSFPRQGAMTSYDSSADHRSGNGGGYRALAGRSDLPGTARGEELAQIAGAGALLGGDELVLHHRLVGAALDGAEHADRRRLVRPRRQMRQLERQA